MKAEVIAIGDELTSGQRLDTNSQWISQRLGELGVRVWYHSTAADELEACSGVFAGAIERADLIIATGGLGPTADDLTREVIASATGTTLIRDDEALETIRGMFARRNREMPESNVVQAMFPEGSRPIPNPHGSAPGIAMEIPRTGRPACHLFALPGVPAELFEMWEQTVGAAVAALQPEPRVIRHRRLKCFGAGESQLEAMLPDLIRRGREPSVGITVSQATITLRVTSAGPSEADCLTAMDPTLATIHKCLGSLVFGEEEDELQDAVARLLVERSATLATVEWGSRGLIAGWLGHVDPQSECFRGGLLVPHGQALTGILGLSPEVVQSHGPISREIVEAMASSARDRLATDYALAVSDFPEFDAAASKPEEFYVALATTRGVKSYAFPYSGHPAILKSLSAKRALNVLRLKLLKQHALEEHPTGH